MLGFLDGLLEPDRFDDLGPNGLQVPGRREVGHVVTGVSAHAELFRRALAEEADLVLVHHGLLWDFHPRRIDRRQAARLRLLLENEVSLVAYHLPLDAHPVVGNNALIAAGLGCGPTEPFGLYRGSPIGVAARFEPDGIDAPELVHRVTALTGREPLVFDAGPQRVRSIAIVSGAAAGEVTVAADAGHDAFLTGEPAEHVMAVAREAGIHFIAAGHYATETFGVRRLGELLEAELGLRHTFLDVPNPV